MSGVSEKLCVVTDGGPAILRQPCRLCGEAVEVVWTAVAKYIFDFGILSQTNWKAADSLNHAKRWIPFSYN